MPFVCAYTIATMPLISFNAACCCYRCRNSVIEMRNCEKERTWGDFISCFICFFSQRYHCRIHWQNCIIKLQNWKIVCLFLPLNFHSFFFCCCCITQTIFTLSSGKNVCLVFRHRTIEKKFPRNSIEKTLQI